LPSRIRSTSNQPNIAVAVAVNVVMNVAPAMPFDATAEPALNPNQPNHSRPAPSIVNGRLCGRIGDIGQPRRRPSTMHNARPAAPELMCTAVPPAKSITCMLLAIQPPFSPVTPLKQNTQWATGKYTMVAQSPANSSHGPNRRRSATAPEINATVMIANIAWNATNTVCGMVPASGMLTAGAPSVAACRYVPLIRPFRPQYCVGSPRKPP
jgi:hypothetical protein